MKKNVLLFVFIVFTANTSFCQDIEFLMSKVKEMKDDTVKLNALNILAEKGPEPAWMDYNKQAYALAQKLSKDKNAAVRMRAKRGEADALNNFGFEADSKGNDSLALNYWTKSLKICLEIKDKKRLATVYNNIGFVYYRKSDFEQALDFYTNSLKYKNEIKDSAGAANTNVNIGSVYLNQGDYVKAKAYYSKSLALYEKLQDDEKIGITYVNIGNIALRLKDYKEALTFFNSSLEIYKKLGHKFGVANSEMNLGVIQHEYFKDDKKANDYYLSALKVFEEVNDSSKVATALTYISRLKLAEGNLAEAYAYSKKAFDLGSKMGFTDELFLTANNHYMICKKAEKYQEAMEALEIAVKMQDKMRAEEFPKQSKKK